MIETTKIYYFIFGILTIAGGAMGYATKGSVASLVAGGVLGVVLVLAGVLVPARFNIGLVLGLTASVILAGKFIPDFLHDKKIVPAGIMALLSAISVVLTIIAWYKR